MTQEDREEIVTYNTNEVIENENSFQSTIKNAELSNKGFFEGGTPDNYDSYQTENYSIFFRPSSSSLPRSSRNCT